MKLESIDKLGGQAAAPAREGQTSVKVWDLPTRVFHWLLAASFAGAYLTSESERLQNIHVMLGYTVAGLIGFRLVWGLIGTRYARFGSFLFPPSRVAGYLRSLLSRAPEHHVGHNPAGAVAIFLLLGLGLLTVLSGFANYQELGGEWLEELHEGMAGTMLAVVAVHVAGVAVSSFLHKENLVAAMVSGIKPGMPDQGIAGSRVVVGVLLLAAVVGGWVANLAGWI